MTGNPEVQAIDGAAHFILSRGAWCKRRSWCKWSMALVWKSPNTAENGSSYSTASIIFSSVMYAQESNLSEFLMEILENSFTSQLPWTRHYYEFMSDRWILLRIERCLMTAGSPPLQPSHSSLVQNKWADWIQSVQTYVTHQTATLTCMCRNIKTSQFNLFPGKGCVYRL